MHEEPVIIKEEIDIDDTKIKLELDEVENEPTMELSCAGSLMKIIEEQPNMITVPVHDIKSEDELQFIESLGMLEQQQKLFVTSSCENNEDPVESTYACKICHLKCENHLALASHQINHQLNRNFCSHGCGYWCNGLEEMLEHEYREHASGNNNWICRICQLDLHNASRLVAHMTSHYVRRFVCALCRRCFNSRQGLQLHRQHSKEICGQLEYVQAHDNDSQLVAVSTLDSEFLTQHDYDVKIKSEPLDDKEEQQLQEVDQLAVNNVVIRTVPKEEACSNNNSTSIAGKLRGKLRLPSIKKPVKSETLPATVQMNPTKQFIPVKKNNIPLKPVSKTSSAKRPNILKPKCIQSKNILQSSNTDPNVAANNNSNNNNSNILKMLPNNCMVIKLPANTKIVKIQPTASSINTNSCTIGSKIINLPMAMSISQTPASAPPVSEVSTIASAATAPQFGRQQALINRNAYFSDLSLFESLPESRKIITEFQNQIRSIEQTLPLPGSVLHVKKSITARGDTRTIGVPTNMQMIQLPLTKESNIKIRELRNHYPEHRFHWQCPQCARCYEQYLPFCNHLTVTHNIPHAEFGNVQVELKIFKKHLDSLPSSTSVIVASEPEASSAPVAPVTEVTVPSPTSSVAGPTKRSKASPKLDSPTKSERDLIKCEVCSKCFTTLGALRIHKMIHTGELPHKCDFCDKRFRTPGQVRVHQRRHTGEKPFKCKVCSLDFTHRETLISHLSRHIGMKRYKCYGCDKSFVVVSGLRAHRRLRPDTCGKVKFTARAHGPRVRVIRGEVVFESHPEHNGYLRSEDPLNILSEINNVNDEAASPPKVTS